jgi:multidrug efflux pump subunit AcrA (membrane-fusion protein)
MTRKLLLLLIVCLVLAACGGQASPTPTAVPVVVDDFAVVADGRLRPAQYVELSFEGGGQIAEVLAAEGEVVAEGDLLARLESSAGLAAQVANAELELLSAQQAVDDLRDTAAFLRAQAAFDVVQAREELRKAEKDLTNVRTPVSEALLDSVADAELALQTAQNNLQLANVSSDVQAFHQAVADADVAWRQYQNLQAEYDKSNGNLDLLDVVKQAQAAWQTLYDRQLALQLAIDTAEANQSDAVAKAQERYDDAAANLAAAQRGPDANKLTLAQARFDLAQATLADAERRLGLVDGGPNPDQLRLAEARVAAAEASLAAARAAHENSELRAPFGGTLARLALKVGEQVAPGQSVATLADFSAWLVETDNLTEIEVVKIRAGQGASIVFDALPDRTLPGRVTAISSVYEEKRGDITYTAKLVLDEPDSALRWGMTAAITFDK